MFGVRAAAAVFVVVSVLLVVSLASEAGNGDGASSLRPEHRGKLNGGRSQQHGPSLSGSLIKI